MQNYNEYSIYCKLSLFKNDKDEEDSNTSDVSSIGGVGHCPVSLAPAGRRRGRATESPPHFFLDWKKIEIHEQNHQLTNITITKKLITTKRDSPIPLKSSLFHFFQKIDTER